jgi:hypothetical protein
MRRVVIQFLIKSERKKLSIFLYLSRGSCWRCDGAQLVIKLSWEINNINKRGIKESAREFVKLLKFRRFRKMLKAVILVGGDRKGEIWVEKEGF